MNDTELFIVVTILSVFIGCVIGFGWVYYDKNVNNENYQSLKPSLDMKPCAELEKTITFGMNQTMVDFSKRNYNERCL